MSSKSQDNRKNITLMLVIVVSVFIICQLPDMTIRIAEQFKAEPHAHERAVRVLFGSTGEQDFKRYVNSVTNLMITLNSSVNFLIYCLVGRKFRYVHKSRLKTVLKFI